jgi:hypothetical protein
VSMPNERTCREMLIPQRMARPGPSKAIRKRSPAVFTSRPRNRANSLRTMTWCCCRVSFTFTHTRTLWLGPKWRTRHDYPESVREYPRPQSLASGSTLTPTGSGSGLSK